jgi:HD superfamily phosphodiesterase
VHQRVQEQARQAIEDTIQNRIENHERVVTALKEENQLGQVPEEPPIPEKIPDSLRQRISSGESRRK